MFHTLYQLSFVALTTINWKRFHVKSSYSCLHPDQKHRLGASDGLQAVVATIYCHLTRPINIELHSDIGKKSKTASLLRSDLIYAAIDSKCAERYSVHFCMISTLIQHFSTKVNRPELYLGYSRIMYAYSTYTYSTYILPQQIKHLVFYSYQSCKR